MEIFRNIIQNTNDIKNIVDKFYASLRKFYSDDNLVNIFDEMITQGINLKLLIDELPNQTLLFEHIFLNIFMEYIHLIDMKNTMKEKEDEEEKVFRNSKTYQKATKVVNMKPYEMKEDKNYKTISKFYQDNEYCCKSNRNLNDFKPNSIKRANNNFQNSMNQIENRVEFQFEKDPSINKVLNLGFTSLLENYNKLKSDFGFLNETCNEYLKVIEILKAVILSHQVYFYLEIE